jgi:hypothetical protein
MNLPGEEEQTVQWVQRVHKAQSQRTPEACEAAKQRIERSRQQEVSYRKCKAAKSYTVRSRALVGEGLRQMTTCSAPAEHMAVQARWRSAQEASKSRQERQMGTADHASALASAPRKTKAVSLLRSVEQDEEEAMQEVAEVVGAANLNAMAAMGEEGLRSSGEAVAGTPAATGRRLQRSEMDTLLAELRREPEKEDVRQSKFELYEEYATEVEEMRGTLLKFHEENKSTLPDAVAIELDRKVREIDSPETMGIPDDAQEWFVYHMMRKAVQNNLNMAGVLDLFEKKLEFLRSNEQAECPVCLEPFGDGEHAPETLSCCHKVCRDCWHNWSSVMHGRPFCPLCRHEEFLGAVVARVEGRAVPAPDSEGEDEF